MSWRGSFYHPSPILLQCYFTPITDSVLLNADNVTPEVCPRFNSSKVTIPLKIRDLSAARQLRSTWDRLSGRTFYLEERRPHVPAPRNPAPANLDPPRSYASCHCFTGRSLSVQPETLR